MIVGLGIDLVTIERVAQVLVRHRTRFASKVLTKSELAEFDRVPSPARFLAKRFAAKEAFAKALGTGIGAAVAWQDLQVAHSPAGQPMFEVRGAAANSLRRRGIVAQHLSISDEQAHAVAVVVLEAKSAPV